MIRCGYVKYISTYRVRYVLIGIKVHVYSYVWRLVHAYSYCGGMHIILSMYKGFKYVHTYKHVRNYAYIIILYVYTV